jgi:acyl transferase domain-containing protein/acyl carrier protein
MGAELAMASPHARAVWDAAADHARWEEWRLADVVFPRPAFSDAERHARHAWLDRPEWAQPAIAVAGAAALGVSEAVGLRPSAVAGEGLGELTALFAAGALTLESLLRIARERGELMSSAAASASGALSLVPSAPAFARLLESVALSEPELEVAGVASDASAIRARLAEHLVKPTRCADQIEALYAAGVRVFLEVGPGAELARVAGECLAGRPHLSVSLDRRGQHGMTALWNALARLAVAGVALDVRPLWQAYLPLPEAATRKAAHSVAISGTNYGKPYPPPGGADALPPPNAARPTPQPVPAAMERSKPAPVAAAELLSSMPEPLQAEGDVWSAFQVIQHETAETQVAYQRATAEVHLEYLRTAQSSLAALFGTTGAAQRVEQPRAVAPPALPPAPLLPVAPPAVALAPPPPPPASADTGPDVKTLLLMVVSEKTGYPRGMLNLDMHIEADLGIDSIKRVEILSAMQERASGLPPVRAADLAALKTLGQIVSFLDGGAPAPHATAAAG